MTNDEKQGGPEVILIERGILLACSDDRLSERVGWVAVEGERIAAVGVGDAPAEWRARAGRVIDARHMAVLPGLTNGHTHLSQTFMRGLADGRPLLRWLREVIWPLQAAMTPEDMYVAATLGLVENLRCGVTTVVQHHKLPGRDHVAAAVRAAVDVGVRMTLARGWVDMGPTGESLDRILADLEWLRDLLQSAIRNPQSTIHHPQSPIPNPQSQIHIASGPLVPWRCSDDAMRTVTALARSWGAATHIHVAEAQDEIELMRQRCGKGHIEWLADLGCLGPDTQLVHCVHVTDAELDLIAAAGATVVYCPTSNMYLASGAAPVRKMLDRGIAVRLGTDGSGSNNSQDLLECAKIAALLAKHATGDAQALLPADVVRMMWECGSRGGWEYGSKEVWGYGSMGVGGAFPRPLAPAPTHPHTHTPTLTPGAVADITIVNLDNTRCQPVHSAASALVYNASGSDVHTVIVGGEILLDAGRVTMLDEAELLEDARQVAHDLLRRAGVTGSGKE